MEKILIIFHSHNGTVEKMSQAIKQGVENNGCSVDLKRAHKATWQDLKTAKGIAIGTPDYFDYMAGTVKDFFDRIFYDSQSKIKGSLVADIPCVFFASGGTGGMPAIESLKSIAQSFKFKLIDFIAIGSQLSNADLQKCEKLGMTLAESVLMNSEKI